jgi:HSP20 family molecular chaperone IbpA
LPENVNDENISAAYKDGILTIELPKTSEEVKASKEISVN